MKTRKHGDGLNHREVVRFSNRLAQSSREVSSSSVFEADFNRGWKAACRYYCHELRVKLREIESRDLIINN